MSVALARAVVVVVVAVAAVALASADATSPVAASCEASLAPREGWFPPPSSAVGMGRGGDRPLPGGAKSAVALVMAVALVVALAVAREVAVAVVNAVAMAGRWRWW